MYEITGNFASAVAIQTLVHAIIKSYWFKQYYIAVNIYKFYIYYQRVSLLACGFPLDLCKREEWSIAHVDNYRTVDTYTEHIAYYIKTEKKCRVILVSWPHGQSVNNVVATDRNLELKFSLKFPSIDDIMQCIVDLMGDCLLFKIYLQHTFRQFKLDPRDISGTHASLGMGNFMILQLHSATDKAPHDRR